MIIVSVVILLSRCQKDISLTLVLHNAHTITIQRYNAVNSIYCIPCIISNLSTPLLKESSLTLPRVRFFVRTNRGKIILECDVVIHVTKISNHDFTCIGNHNNLLQRKTLCDVIMMSISCIILIHFKWYYTIAMQTRLVACLIVKEISLKVIMKN